MLDFIISYKIYECLKCIKEAFNSRICLLVSYEVEHQDISCIKEIYKIFESPRNYNMDTIIKLLNKIQSQKKIVHDQAHQVRVKLFLYCTLQQLQQLLIEDETGLIYGIATNLIAQK